jgi:hypothetical protein
VIEHVHATVEDDEELARPVAAPEQIVAVADGFLRAEGRDPRDHLGRQHRECLRLAGKGITGIALDRFGHGRGR